MQIGQKFVPHQKQFKNAKNKHTGAYNCNIFYSRLNYNTVKSLLDSFKVLNNNGVIQFESLLSHVFGS